MCRNKKLADNKCPTCNKDVPDETEDFYCIADIVMQRKDKTFLNKKLFKPDLEKILPLPDLRTLEDPKLRDYLAERLPVNAHGIFANGAVTILSAKRSLD